MAGDLTSGLKDWLLSFGFDRQNLSDAQIESEFKKLTPPEMRDIWRNTMIHVVPVEKKRYIKKVLLLNELKKLRSLKGDRLPFPKNLKSVAELETYRVYSKALLQLKKRELLINDLRAKIGELVRNFEKLNEERRCLIEEKEMQNHIFTLLRLKINQYEKLNEELIDAYDCLKYVGSNSLNLSDAKKKPPTDELLENLITKVHEFDVRRHTLNDDELIVEQQKLQEDIIDLTKNIESSALLQNVIHSLENALNSLLKLMEQVMAESRVTNNDVHFEWDLPELKKQCVRTYIDNNKLRLKVKEREKKIQEQLSALILNFEKHCKDEYEQTIVKNWLDTEFLKQRMTSRHKFLSNAEEIATNEMSTLSDVAYSSAPEKNKFLKRIYDISVQMARLEKEIGCNLSYLSDKSIDLLVNYQKCCENSVEEFLQKEKSYNYEEASVEPPDLLKIEIGLLQNVNLVPEDRKHSKREIDNAIACTSIVERARKVNFFLHMELACNDFFQRVGHLNFADAVIVDRIQKVKFSEEEFGALLRKLLEETKKNLECIKLEGEACSNNLNLWTDFSVDELIPEHMIVDKYTFSQWQEKFQACVRYLPK